MIYLFTTFLVGDLKSLMHTCVERLPRFHLSFEMTDSPGNSNGSKYQCFSGNANITALMLF